MSDDMTGLAHPMPGCVMRLTLTVHISSLNRNGNLIHPVDADKFKAFFAAEIPVSIRTMLRQSGYMTFATALLQALSAGLTAGNLFTGALTCGHTWGIKNCPQPCTTSISFRKTS